MCAKLQFGSGCGGGSSKVAENDQKSRLFLMLRVLIQIGHDAKFASLRSEAIESPDGYLVEIRDYGCLPLDVFIRQTPPGWRPRLSKYPRRLYTQLMKLCWRRMRPKSRSARR